MNFQLIILGLIIAAIGTLIAGIGWNWDKIKSRNNEVSSVKPSIAAESIILPKQRDTLVSILIKDRGKTITINSVMGDQEGLQFALELKGVFNASGWYVNGVNRYNYAGPISGLMITGPKMPAHVDTIAQAFDQIGMNVSRVINTHLQESDLELVVGTQSYK